jgi:antirestriction protein ArdC
MTQTPTKSEPRDFRAEVTENIIKLLEDGVAPWQKPWDGGSFMPINHTTQKPYRGGNALYLMVVAMKRGYGDPRWMTYKQAQERDWQVRKGEKGTQVEFWEIKPVARSDAPAEGQGDSKGESTGEAENEARQRRFVHRVYTVFNAKQIDGVPALAIRAPNVIEAVEAGEKILTNSGAKIEHDQFNNAYYSRLTDDIHLPKREYFKDTAGYYGTALHELAHWTGHPTRLNRPTLTDAYRFGDTNYAKEELRAELTSVFLAAERGIPHDPDRHAAYVGSWIKALKDDKNEIFKAAHDASAAAEYLLGLERGQAQEGESGTHTERFKQIPRSTPYQGI